MKFYPTVKPSNIHFITKFGRNVLQNDKLMLFQPRQPLPPFLSIPSIFFTDSLLMSLKRASLFGDEMRMQTWRRTGLLQTLGVTTIGSHSHVGRHLVKIATALLTCSCSSSAQMVCKATFNSSVILCFGWSLWYFSSMEPQM